MDKENLAWTETWTGVLSYGQRELHIQSETGRVHKLNGHSGTLMLFISNIKSQITAYIAVKDRDVSFWRRFLWSDETI